MTFTPSAFTLQQRKESLLPYAYLLLTHGPKPKGEIRSHPAAKQQLHNLQVLVEASERPEHVVLAYDYSRHFEYLDDLPILKARLELAKELGTKVIIDDFRRLTANCVQNNPVELYNEICEYKGHFMDLRTGKDIGELTQVMKISILSATSPIKYVRKPIPRKKRSAEERRDQTLNATLASQFARSQAADSKAEELAALWGKLLSTNASVTHRELAEAANDEGLLTTRKGSWTASSVGRTLKRLEAKPKTLAERAKHKFK